MHLLQTEMCPRTHVTILIVQMNFILFVCHKIGEVQFKKKVCFLLRINSADRREFKMRFKFFFNAISLGT